MSYRHNFLVFFFGDKKESKGKNNAVVLFYFINCT